MTCNARCWKRRLAALAIVTSLLSGCATVRSEYDRLATCPPVVEYGREFQTRAADELVLLPKGSAIAEMLADYGVMREQALSCRKRITLYSPNSVRSRSSISAESMPFSSVVVTRIPASPFPSSSGNTP